MKISLFSLNINEVELTMGDIVITISEKPIFESFSYDYIYFEKVKDKLYSSFYFKDHKKYDMTEKNTLECYNFIAEYENLDTYYVYAYDNNGIFDSFMLKSEAINKKLLYTTKKPEFSVSKWEDNKWNNVIIIVKSDGTLIKNPSSYCNQCSLFLTQKNIENMPKILDYNDIYHKWDIEQNDWVEVGNEFEDFYNEVEQKIRNKFNLKLISLYNGYVPEYERMFWDVEISEALSYKGNKEHKTPYLDGILSVIEPKIEKEKYIEKILKYCSDDFVYECGKIHGELYTYIYKLRELKTLDELKAFNVNI